MRLAGTLTLPKGKGPFPAVVMITGSGAQDRDEALLGHKPFLVIADRLTRDGIAVLRVDDRGFGKSTGDFLKASIEDFAVDTEAQAAWLRKRPDIDPRHIGLIGHSEGGIVGPMVAAKDPKIAFVVMMAGPGAPAQRGAEGPTRPAGARHGDLGGKSRPERGADGQGARGDARREGPGRRRGPGAGGADAQATPRSDSLRRRRRPRPSSSARPSCAA